MRTGFWEILIIILLIIILFGHTKIPDLMKNIANGINIFKNELNKANKKEVEETNKKAINKKVKKSK